MAAHSTGELMTDDEIAGKNQSSPLVLDLDGDEIELKAKDTGNVG